MQAKMLYHKSFDFLNFYYIICFWVRQTVAHFTCEESPGSIEQGCLITSGVGNYRESATENTPPKQLGCGKVEMAR